MRQLPLKYFTILIFFPFSFINAQQTNPANFITRIPLKATTAPSLAESKDYLLWYKGKKINDSTLITPDASIVLHRSKKGEVVVQPQVKKDPTPQFEAEMSKSKQKKELLFNEIADKKTGVLLFPAINGAMNEYDKIDQEYSQILQNKVYLPEPVPNSATISRQPSGGYANYKIDFQLPIPPHIRNAYNKIMTDRKNYPSIETSAPPQDDLRFCTSCENDEEGKTYKNWSENFDKYESQLIKGSLSIFNSLQQLKLNNDPEALTMRNDLNKVIEFAFARLDNKIDLLIRNHGKDISRLAYIIKKVLSIERQKQLITDSDATFSKNLSRLLALFENFDSYLNTQIQERNYDVVLNIPNILGLERQRQLLGGKNDKSSAYIQKINAFNRFKIEYQVSYSYEGEDCGTSTDNAQAENARDAYVSLFPMGCKFGLMAHESNIQDGAIHQFGLDHPIELKFTRATYVQKVNHDTEDRCITKTHNYSNLPLYMAVPFVKMTFCENVDDSIYVSFTRAKPKNANTTIYNTISSLFNSWEDEEKLPVHDELEAVNAQLEPFTVNESRTARKLGLEESRNFSNLIMKRAELASEVNKNDKLSKKFLESFDGVNGEPTIISVESTINHAPEHSEERATFRITIKVVHEPLPTSN